MSKHTVPPSWDDQAKRTVLRELTAPGVPVPLSVGFNDHAPGRFLSMVFGSIAAVEAFADFHGLSAWLQGPRYGVGYTVRRRYFHCYTELFGCTLMMYGQDSVPDDVRDDLVRAALEDQVTA